MKCGAEDGLEEDTEREPKRSEVDWPLLGLKHPFAKRGIGVPKIDDTAPALLASKKSGAE